MRTLIRNARRLYTCNDGDDAFEQGYLCVEDGLIVAVGGGQPPWQEADHVFDLPNAIVTPGFVNVHHHFFQSLTRAVPLAQRTLSLDWMAALYPLWAEYDLEALYRASLASAAELLLSGATTSVDHSNLHLTDSLDTVEVQIAAARDLGLRLHLVRGALLSMEAGIEARLRPLLGDQIDHLLGRGVDVMALIERTLRTFQSRAHGATVDISIGPGGVAYDRPELMAAHGRLARDYDCGLHTHYHPRQIERQISREKTGGEPLDFLEASGWLGPSTWLAHCTELTDDEIARLAERGVGVAHCARTAIRLGYDIPRIGAMRKAGVRVGIGVDGAASNDSGSMLGDMRLAQLLHRSGPDKAAPDTWLTPYDMLLAATRDGAAILRRTDIGQLTVGCCGDVTAFDLKHPSYAGAAADPLGALLMSGADTDAALTVVAGVPRVIGGSLVDVNHERIIADADASAGMIIARAEARTGLRFGLYPGAARSPRWHPDA
jgi:8-oxoguanine deaminase